MKKIVTGIIFSLFSILLLLPISVGVYLTYHHNSEYHYLCIEHCIENLNIVDLQGVFLFIQELFGKIFLGVSLGLSFISWKFKFYSLIYFRKYYNFQCNFYISLIGIVKSRK